MKFNEKRSTDRILRYFELLEWKNQKCKDMTLEGLEEQLRQELKSVEEELHTVDNLMTEKSRLYLSNQREIDHVRSNILQTEKTISSVKNEIIATRNKIVEYRQNFSKGNDSNTSKHKNELTLDFIGVLSQLFLGVWEDIKAICLDLWQAIIRLKISILAQYLLSLLIVIFFVDQLDYYINTILSLTLIALYVCFKFFSILKRINRNRKYLYEKRADFQKEAYRQKQDLELYINELEKRNEIQAEYLVRQRLHEKKLDARTQEIDNDVTSLKKRQERLIDSQQNKCCELKNHESMARELLDLDKLTEHWLEQEIEGQINKAMRKLHLSGSEYIDEREALKIDPIRSLIGCTSRTLANQLVNNEDEDEDSPRRKEILERYAADAKSADDCSGQRRRYGLYEFTVFFLCSDFFNYYKCYYNFVRGKPIDEEYSEYLYDSIVFTKVQENSSINKTSNQIQVSSQRLTISTNDGKTISLQINKSRGDKKLSSKIKTIDEAATKIRRILRQRELPGDT